MPGGRDVADPASVERHGSLNFCFTAFAASPAALRVELSGPSLRKPIVLHDTRGKGQWTFETNGLKRGVYQYRATLDIHGSSTEAVRGQITIVPARQPSVRKIATGSTSPPRALRFELVGYPPNSRVQVFLYASTSFVRPLPQAVIGADGEGTYSWPVDSRLPAERLAIWVSPTPPGCERKACVAW